MAHFTSIRAAYRETGENRDIHTIKRRWGHIVWITLATGERHRVLVSTGTNGQTRNISHAISGHHIATISAADWPAMATPEACKVKGWRGVPGQVAQRTIDRISKRNGHQLVADTLRQCAIVGPVLNPEYIGRG